MLQADVPDGVYVVAVSGGVDSMALLDMLRRKPGLQLTVAHFDHGIRADSHLDQQMVHAAAQQAGLPYVSAQGNLGSGASEAAAREARYAFLRQVQQQVGARAIITAHHQDDVLETAILNVLRGTGRKGLAALRSNPHVVRPLLHVPKTALVAYAQAHDVQWREDSTNANDDYLRNYIRHQLVPRLGEGGRQKMLQHIRQAGTLNSAIDAQLLIEMPDSQVDRRWFARLPHAVAADALAAWLRHHGVRDFDRKTIQRLVVAAKVAAPGKVVDVNADHLLNVHKTYFQLQRRSAS